MTDRKKERKREGKIYYNAHRGNEKRKKEREKENKYT